MSSPALPHLIVTGAAGHGKDTIGDHLVASYGYTRLSFSDGIRDEIAEAYRQAPQPVTQAWQSDQRIKNEPDARLALVYCTDERFIGIALQAFEAEDAAIGPRPASESDRLLLPRSPRRIQQIWGTEHRRSEDQDYWLKYVERTVDWEKPQVFTSIRYDNELNLAYRIGGVRIHVDRPGHDRGGDHQSEQGLPLDPDTIVVRNDADIPALHRRIDGVVLRFAARRVCDTARSLRPRL